MLHKTRGIVLKTTDYAENSVIIQVFTEKFGIQSYIINGVKKPKARIKQNILQPLYLLDLVVYHKPLGNVQRVSEIKPFYVFQSIPYDIRKSSIALFLNEVLYRSVKQQSADQQLFDFVFNSIELFDRIEKGVSVFHLYFLLHLSRYLGFYPEMSNSKAPYFDLKEGIFSDILPKHPLVVRGRETQLWVQLLNGTFERLTEVKISTSEKRVVLNHILDYYRLHVEGLPEINSYKILADVLS